MTYDLAHWGGKLPKVSGQCITYGRTTLLAEAVECFLRQDYPGEKELVILNDHPDMTIVSNHPQVIVHNHTTRFPTIGGKRNYCCKLCTGDIIFPWDDDDICLPHRISYSLQQMKNKHYYKPDRFWYWSGGRVSPEPKRNTAHAMGCFSSEFFWEVGGYPEIQSGQDIALEKLFEGPRRNVQDIPDEDIYYIYRYGGTQSYHLSSYGYGKGFSESAKYVSKAKLPKEYVLKPHLSNDWVGLIRKILDAKNNGDTAYSPEASITPKKEDRTKKPGTTVRVVDPALPVPVAKPVVPTEKDYEFSRLRGTNLYDHKEILLKVYPELRGVVTTAAAGIRRGNCKGCARNKYTNPITAQLMSMRYDGRDLSALIPIIGTQGVQSLQEAGR